MSWYKDQAEKKTAELSAIRPSSAKPRTIFANRLDKKVPITLIVTNLNTPADGENLSQSLLEMQGIIQVEPIIQQKKLVILYNPSLIGLNSITYRIASLGYHYVQRG